MIPDAFHPVCKAPLFFESAAGADALRRLEEGAGAREPFLVLTGETGTGKTTLANTAIARWESRVVAAYLAGPMLRGAELLEEIVLHFGGEPPDGLSRPKLVGCLERELAKISKRGKIPLLVVDDAQNASPEWLEELRLLVNAAQQARLPLEVLLIGLPSLASMLDDPALATLRSRVSVRAHIEPLSVAETRRYLRHRLDAIGGDGARVFPKKTCAEIAALTGGVPRRINALASEALRLAQLAEEPVVLARHVRDAAASLAGSTPPRVEREVEEEDAADAPPDVDVPRAVASDRPLPAKQPVPVSNPPAPATPRAPARSVSAPVPAADLADIPPPVVPATHDPDEWVRRFIGDQGPPRIGGAIAPPVTSPIESPTRVTSPVERPARATSPAERPTRVASPVEGSPRVTSPVERPTRVAPPVESPPRVTLPVENPKRVTALDEVAVAEPFPAREAAPRAPSSGVPRPRRPALRGVPSRMITIALVAIVVCAALLVVYRASRSRLASRQSAAVTSVRPSDDRIAAARRAVPATKKADVAATPSDNARSTDEPAPGKSTADAAPPASEPRVSPTGRWTVDVGGYGDLGNAFEARSRVEELTGIEAWVIPAREGARERHRIVLGVYRARARAVSLAKMLVSSGTLPEAEVVPLPKPSQRQ